MLNDKRTDHGWGLAVLVAFFLVVVALQASLKLIWGDELFTYYIARQPGLRGVWAALQAGADPNPPLTHLLVKASTWLFGSASLAIRLPAILSMLLAVVCIWSMLRRWVRPAFAAAGVLAFMATRGFDYAYDARSYSPMMGFAMASLALWMAASDRSGWRRTAALGAMALALAAGISSNYYCVLAFFPIAVGEALRQSEARRFRLDTWLALALASLPLVAYLPLIRHNIAEFGPHAWNRPHASMIAMSYLELVEGIFWPVLGLAIFVLLKRRGPWAIPRAEAAAVGVLLVYPLLGFAIAVGGAGMISPRCVAPVCCGFGLAAGVLAQRVLGGMRRGAVSVVALLVLWVVVREGICGAVLWQQRRAFEAISKTVATGTGQIVVGDSSFVLPFYFYASPDVQRRIVFPVDFDAIHRIEPDDSGEQNLWAGRNDVFPFRILSFSQLTFKPATDTLVARPKGWLVDDLGRSPFPPTLTPQEDPAWDNLGGIFTPMAHPDTRILRGTSPVPRNGRKD